MTSTPTPQTQTQPSVMDNEVITSMAADNDPVALQMLGEAYYEANQHEQAVQYFKRAADLDLLKAQLTYAYCLYKGCGVEVDKEKAIEYYEKAADKGSDQAKGSLGVIYFQTGLDDNQPESFTRALPLLEAGASVGLVAALYLLGIMYKKGYGVGVDNGIAMGYLTRAADLGHVDAAYLVFKLGGGLEYMQTAAGAGYPKALYDMALTHQDRGDAAKAAELFKLATDAGHTQAIYEYAMCLCYGNGVSMNKAECVKYLLMINTDEAYLNLGLMYEDGDGVEKNMEKAAENYQKGAQLGNLTCIFYLAKCYKYGKGVEVNVQKCISLFEQAAEKAHASSAIGLWSIYCNPTKYGIPPNNEALFKWTSKAVELDPNNPTMLNNLGRLFYDAKGVDQNKDKAAELWLQAAEKGSKHALCNLGLYYFYNQNYEKAVSYFTQTKDLKRCNGQYLLARCYTKGRGVDIDLAKAFDLHTFSCKHGLAWGKVRSKSKLGRCHELGRGCDVDTENAAALYKECADSGYSKAMYHLAKHYEKNQKSNEAFKWYKAAADKGLIKAHVELAECYHHGYGVEKDNTLAFNHYLTAAKGGHAESMVSVGDSYAHAWGTEKNDNCAFEWYNKARINEHPRGYVAVADCFWVGRGIDKNPSQAVEYYRIASEMGDIVGKYEYADVFREGQYASKDMDKYLTLTEESAQGGHTPAQVTAVACFLCGVYDVSKDAAKAIQYLHLLAEKGWTRAFFLLGFLYYEKKEYDSSYKAFKQAVQENVREAHIFLSMLESVEKNTVMAIPDWENVDENDYDILEGFTEDVDDEVLSCIRTHYSQIIQRFFRKVCDGLYTLAKQKYANKQYDDAFLAFSYLSKQKHMNAMYYTGECYFTGRGVARNVDAAVECFNEFLAEHGKQPNVEDMEQDTLASKANVYLEYSRYDLADLKSFALEYSRKRKGSMSTSTRPCKKQRQGIQHTVIDLTEETP